MMARLATLIAWSRRHAVLVVTVAVIAGLILGFVLLAGWVTDAESDATDAAILRAMRTDAGDPIGPVWFEQAVLDISALGAGAVATVIVILTAAYLLLAGHPRHALLLIVCALGTALAVNALKYGYERPRPSVVEPLAQETGHSFPSGHTFLASALYPTLGAVAAAASRRRRLQIFLFAAAAMLALIVGWTRVYIGVHYPTDVLGGWTLGLAWALALGAASRLLQGKGVVEQPEGDVVVTAP